MHEAIFTQELVGDRVVLVPADEDNVDRLIEWTLDDEAQGPYRGVPELDESEAREMLLESEDRWFYLITDGDTGKPLGRLKVEEHRFDDEEGRIDWEISLFVALPDRRGLGYGTAAQKLISDHLLKQDETRSVFASTKSGNLGEQRALQNAGFQRRGPLPSAHYRVEVPSDPHLLFVRLKDESTVTP